MTRSAASPTTRSPLTLRCACALIAAAAVSIAAAQSSNERITPNFRDTDISQIAEAVSMATHKTFIMDPRVRANVTMYASTPMSPDAFYQMFLAILQVHGFIAVPSGNFIKIIPDANARVYPSDDLPEHVSPSSDEIVTTVIPVKNVSATQLVPVLRPLVAQTGHLQAYTQSNTLIISDRAANVSRIMRIVGRIDQASDADVDVVSMQNASATEVARVVTSIFQQQGQPEPGGQPLKLVADERSNSILVSGEPAARLRAKVLIAHLDTPLQEGGNTRVRYLRYADAEKLAPKLKEQLTGLTQTAAGGGAQGGGASAATAAERNTGVWADPQNNALIITAPPKVRQELMTIIDQLDIRRAQVLVEAIIVDVDVDKSAELGVNWAVFSENASNTTIPGATFLTPVGGASLVDLASAIQNPQNLSSALTSGTTVALGRVAKTGVSFAAMLRALQSDDNSNIIATPSALTLDHQEAQIKIATEVPFLTGQYTTPTAASTSTGAVTPFQTIQRQEVGTILKLTPQINEGDSVILKIDLESSSVIPKNAGPEGAVDLTTSKRTVSTNVLIEDGGIIVIGGLISNEYDRTSTSVPLLSKIPLIGEFFKDHTATQTKKNLMVFIRPQILRDASDTAIQTNSKYSIIREEQKQVGSIGKLELPLLPGVKDPVLPALPPPPPKGSTPLAPVTTSEKKKAAEEAAADARSRPDGASSQAAPAAPQASGTAGPTAAAPAAAAPAPAESTAAAPPSAAPAPASPAPAAPATTPQPESPR